MASNEALSPDDEKDETETVDLSQQKEEILSEPNTEPINFRVPRTMKSALKDICEYEQYSSAGELLRTLLRQHYLEVVNSQGYKFWMKRKEEKPK